MQHKENLKQKLLMVKFTNTARSVKEERIFGHQVTVYIAQMIMILPSGKEEITREETITLITTLLLVT